jgi:hypothetical protein
MKRIAPALPLAFVAALLSGCLAVARYSFSFDFATGEAQWTYYDIGSDKSDCKDEKDECSMAKDWADLKEMVAKKQVNNDHDPNVVEDVSKTLFEQNKTLCGRHVEKVKCPKCFPSKVAVLSYLHDKDWRFEVINKEIVAFVPTGKKVLSTNGQKAITARNSIITWPEEATIFNY